MTVAEFATKRVVSTTMILLFMIFFRIHDYAFDEEGIDT